MNATERRTLSRLRKEAFAVATAAGQVLYGPHLSGGELDSSDLY